jgi:hypothetical protein
MSTSGDQTYLITTSGIIQKAFELAEIIAPGESIPGEDYNSALVSLNAMIKHWQAAKGLYMHHMEEATLFLMPGQRTYQIGNSSPDFCGISTNLVETQLTAANNIGNTLLTVNSTSGMLTGDYIGIVQDNSTLLWGTISNVNSSTTVTTNTALTTTAAIGNMVFTYRTNAGRPLEIYNMVLRQSGGTDSILSQAISEIQISPMSVDEYFKLPSKGTQGTTIKYSMFKKNNYNQLNIYPVPSTSIYRLKFLYSRIIENFDNSSDNPDLPQEYCKALYWNLAAELAAQYKKYEVLQYLDSKSNLYLHEACSVSQENNISLMLTASGFNDHAQN